MGEVQNKGSNVKQFYNYIQVLEFERLISHI
jgi:hypothetical protein